MDRSPYLVQALQALGQAPQQPAQTALFSPEQLAQIGKDRAAFEAANPGQSYVRNSLQHIGQNIAGAPGALMAAPGNAVSGFAELARSLTPRRG